MLKTLVIEKNARFRDSLISLLGKHFSAMVFEKASNSEEALIKFHQFSPELVFVDIQVPGKNGLQLSKILRSGNRNTVIVILANNDGPEYRKAANQCGANFFLSKGSSSIDEILDIVKFSISKKSACHWQLDGSWNHSARSANP